VPRWRAAAPAAFNSLGALSFLCGRNALIYLPERWQYHDNFVAVLEANSAMDGYYHGYRYGDFRLWFLPDDNTNTYIGLASMYFYPWGSTVNRMKSARELFTFPQTVRLKEGSRMVVVSSRSNPRQVASETDRALAPYNMTLQFQSARRIHHRDIDFNLYFTIATAKATARP